MSTKLKNNEGYILLEIILAVAILAGGLLVVVRTLTEATAVEGVLKNRTIALVLLGERTAGLRQSVLEGRHGKAIAISQTRGDFGERAPAFSWSITPITDTKVRGDWVTVKVSWKDARVERSVEARTLLAPAPPGEMVSENESE